LSRVAVRLIVPLVDERWTFKIGEATMLRRFRPVVLLGAFLGVVLPLAIPAAAAPSFEVTTSTPTAEKGHNFTILVHVSVEEPLEQLTVTGIAPDGFCLEALKIPWVTAVRSLHPLDKSTNGDAPVPECAGLPGIVELGPLGRSSFVVPFIVTPPDLSGRPRTGKKGSLYSTREQKEFAFDMIWTAKSGDERVQGNAAATIKLRYTTTIGHYLGLGLLGVLLGFVVKTTTQEREDFRTFLEQRESVPHKLLAIPLFLIVDRLPSLLTILVLGFGVLLTLAQDALPVSSWHQALALGIGLGIVGDEKLISRLRG
jgi:hypothetical protein